MGIYDSQGSFIVRSSPSVQPDSGQAEIAEEIVPKYLSGQIEEPGARLLEVEGVQSIVGYSIIKNASWVFCSSQALSELLRPVVFLVLVMFLILLAAFAITLMLSNRLLRRFAKPVASLVSVFNKAANEQRYLPCEISGTTEFQELAIGYNTMIETLKAQQEQTEKLALFDPVTGIHNRTYFNQRICELLEQDETGGIIYIDLDGFKHINDVFGHNIGDSCLKILAERLSNSRMELDSVIRFGGDEFFLIKLGERNEIENTINAVLELIRTPIVLDSAIINLTASIGISLFPEDGADITSLMTNTDLAMYSVKDSGRNSFTFFDKAMTAQLRRRMDILDVLKSAVVTGEASLVYQPEVNMDTGKICAFETLMRLNGEKLGFVSPMEFIPIAENSGEIINIGRWVMESACVFAKRLLDKGARFNYVSVNVSAAQLEDPLFLDSVQEALAKSDLPASYLQVEITESLLISKYDENVGKLSMLRFFGVSTALDDFGTGYSSLNYLTQLPIDTLKIDKAFIKDIAYSPKTKTICRMIIDMAHSLGMQVVAEGIEYEIQADILKELNCDILQGYLTGRPLPMLELERQLLSDRKLF